MVDTGLPIRRTDRPTVLVTGAGGGIGRAVVARFEKASWTVIATERTGPSALDVTDEASVLEARQRFGVPDVLVNNAGLGLLAPMIETSDELLLKQFEVNVRGLARVTRAFVPEMCRRGHGRVINVGSLAGRLTLPWFGSYAATKYAVEAISDALRLECASFGVRVSLIEPTIVGTGFVDVALASLERAAQGSLFRPALLAAITRRADFTRAQVAPEVVAEHIFRAATARRPKARYRVGRLASFLITAASLLPTPLVDVLLRSYTGLTPARSLPPPEESPA